MKKCFPAGVVQRAAVLQYGDNPEIEPGELMVRVVLEPASGTRDYDQALDAFIHDHKPGLAQVRRYLSSELPERPAYAQLRERAREIDRLKNEF